MEDRRIRIATAGDVPALLALYRHLIPDEQGAEPDLARARLDALAAIPGCGIWIADTDAGVVASVTLIVVPNMTRRGAPYAFIENVVCHADHRRQGHVTALLHAAEGHAWNLGCYRIMIVSGNHNTDAHATYVAAGYAPGKTGFQKRRIADRATRG
jgi:GNAT superfamily N-acetyltransferase